MLSTPPPGSALTRPFTVDVSGWIRLYIEVLPLQSRGREAGHPHPFEMNCKASKSETNHESGHKIELWTFNCQAKILGFVLLSFFKSQKVTFDKHTHQ
jgi:hypothetical protein